MSKFQVFYIRLNIFFLPFCSSPLAERHGMKDPAKVSQLQNRIIGCLNDHVTFNTSAPNRSNFLSRILLQLPELRVLSQKGLQRLYSLKVEGAVQAPQLVEKMFQPNLPY